MLCGAKALRHDLLASVQSIQIDNQLASAVYPVLLSRREHIVASAVARVATGAGLLKAAERQREQQALGPPQVLMRLERDLSAAGASDDSIIIKCAPQKAVVACVA